jgi:lysophospholipase L1-like esterase
MIPTRKKIHSAGTLGAILLVVGIVVYMNDSFRFVKTVCLIARVAPYEQAGEGAGAVQFFGDSTGYGTGATAGKYSVAGRLGADYPAYSIKNSSVNGRTITELLEDTEDYSKQSDLIVLQIGANDILQKRDLDTALSDLEILIQRLAPLTQEIVLLTSGNVGGAKAFSGTESEQLETLTRSYRQRVIALAAKTPDFTYVDLFDEPEADPFVENPQRYTSIDGLHPSNDGYRLWYEKAKPAFDQALNK